jgi:hypothetical protein
MTGPVMGSAALAWWKMRATTSVSVSSFFQSVAWFHT